MSIKWDNIKILSSPLTNNIYLGKLDKTGMFSTDKSSDRSQEVMAAAIGYLDKSLKEGQNRLTITCEAGVLTWVRKTEAPPSETKGEN